MFYNPTNNHVYAAFNTQALATAQALKGWSSEQFAGFNQWLKAGRIVRKGEHGTPIVFYVPKKVPGPAGQTETKKVRKVKFVFNIEQTDEAAA